MSDSRGVSDTRSHEMTRDARRVGQSVGNEGALEEAIRLAARAGHWEVVMVLAAELRARR